MWMINWDGLALLTAKFWITASSKPAARHRNRAKLLLCNKSNFSHVLSGILLIITYLRIMDASRFTKLTVKPYLLRIPDLTQNLYSFDSDGNVIINGDWERIYTQEVALYFETLTEQRLKTTFEVSFWLATSSCLVRHIKRATASFFFSFQLTLHSVTSVTYSVFCMSEFYGTPYNKKGVHNLRQSTCNI